MAGAQLHEILICLVDTELDKALFELNLLSKWENEQYRREMRLPSFHRAHFIEVFFIEVFFIEDFFIEGLFYRGTFLSRVFFIEGHFYRDGYFIVSIYIFLHSYQRQTELSRYM